MPVMVPEEDISIDELLIIAFVSGVPPERIEIPLESNRWPTGPPDPLNVILILELFIKQESRSPKLSVFISMPRIGPWSDLVTAILQLLMLKLAGNTSKL